MKFRLVSAQENRNTNEPDRVLQVSLEHGQDDSISILGRYNKTEQPVPFFRVYSNGRCSTLKRGLKSLSIEPYHEE